MNRMKRLISLMLFVCGMAAGMWAQSTSDVLNGEFTINASGGKVVFSKGNLQKVNNVLQFAENQYVYFGTNQSDSHCDLFSYSESSTFPDDGISWRILSQAEWEYLYISRNVNNTLSSGARYSKATIGGAYKGVIVFPDNYSHPSGAEFSGNCNNATENYTSTVSLDGWAKMEAAGCVFLPAAGYVTRSPGNESNYVNEMVDKACIYTCSTGLESNTRYTPGFYNNKIDLGDWSYKISLVSVRPVQFISNLQQDNEGYYLLGSLQDWKYFASWVKEIAPDAKAKMTADINLGDDQTRIGTSSAKYQGTFDGQGHTLTINYTSTGNYSAPFRYIEGATIKNLHVAGTIHTSHCFIGGLVGASYGTSNIENSQSSVELISSYNGDAVHSGFVACIGGGTLNIKDCLFDGILTGSSALTWGGFVGWKYNYTANINNCLFIPESVNVGAQYSATFSGNGGTVKNSYYTVCLNNSTQGTQATTAQLADGTTATALQANRSETVWVQDPLTNQPMLKLFANKISYTMPTSGLGTFSAKAKCALPEGLEAYYCKNYDKIAGTISVVAIEGAVPAETGVLLRGTAGATYTLTGTNAAAATVTDNALVAVTKQTTIQPTADGYTNFGLSGGVFKKVNEAGGTVKANRAYLHIPTTAGAREISLVWDEDVTAIGKEAIVKGAESAPGQWYTIGGRKLAGQPSQKGIYIVNGKKVVIK